MDLLTFPPFLAFLLPLIFASPAISFCPFTTCNNDTITPIRFPFRIHHQQPKNCSYRGFDLSCTDQGFTALNLPHSGKFLVRFIRYQTQNIQIYDPNNCLPRKLLDGFDPSGSPFQADFYVNYTFLRCPRSFTDGKFTVIDCLSNSTTSVIATSHSMFDLEVSKKSCQIIRSLPVPVSLPQNDELTSSLEDDIWLSWAVPDCRECEAEAGVCTFQGNGSQQVGCFYGYGDQGGSEYKDNGKNMKIFRIIAYSIAGPAILCAVAVGTLLCLKDMRNARGSVANRGQEQEQTEVVTVGLDQATIDSYTKVILGESRRVPGLNDGSCPICLSEFSAKDTLRCIPHCTHCFHSDCIDEWLRLNGTCPICRNTPTHHLQVQTS